MLERIDHVNLVVRDLPAMTAFYCDTLGLRETKRVTIEGAWIERIVGLAGVKADVVYLDPPAGPRIELIRYHSPPTPAPPPPPPPPGGGDGGGANLAGLRHLAFRVGDIEVEVARLRAAGVRFLSDVQRVPDGQVTYAGGVRKRLVYFRDPEGNLLELCEYAAA